MQNYVIPITIPAEIMIALNESESELQNYCQASIAIMLFEEEKLTIGKAVQLSGLGRYEFEKQLAKRNIPIVNPNINDVFTDMNKLREL